MRELKLGDNGITHVGLTELCVALAPTLELTQRPALRLLDLHGNGIEAPGVGALVQIAHSRVDALDVSDNPLGVRGLLELCEGLRADAPV